ncbi:uncharacterized protein [Henckelia pumila]|uniref:uncharacterized protein n=1 Tax=Henckelia pumila TaxID=405737 RepID=UPI003C6DC2EC
MKSDGTIDKYKVRLVIKGYSQREGLDYFDTYSPVTRITSIRVILAIDALRNLEVYQMDVKTTFLNGDLEEEIYMKQPEGFSAPGQENKVCKLVKSLYPAVIEGYSDANWISDMKDSKSTSEFVSSKQTIIARSTMESEFIALDKCAQEAEWLRLFLKDVPGWVKPIPAICIHCDSQSAIGRAQSKMYNGKSRHIHRRHNTIRQLLSTGVISIDYVNSKDNIADPLTKGLNRELVEKSSRGMGLKPMFKYIASTVNQYITMLSQGKVQRTSVCVDPQASCGGDKSVLRKLYLLQTSAYKTSTMQVRRIDLVQSGEDDGYKKASI